MILKLSDINKIYKVMNIIINANSKSTDTIINAPDDMNDEEFEYSLNQKFHNLIAYSSSPTEVFTDIDKVIKDFSSEKELILLRYKIVLQELIIKDLQKNVKKYECGHQMWCNFINSF